NAQVDTDQPPMVHPASLRRVPLHRLARRSDAPSGHGPKKTRPAAAPPHVLQPGPASKDRPTSLIPGTRRQPRAVHRTTGPSPCGPPPVHLSTPPQGPAGDDHATPWDPTPVVDPQEPVSLTCAPRLLNSYPWIGIHTRRYADLSREVMCRAASSKVRELHLS